jgi:hypothetical protein
MGILAYFRRNGRHDTTSRERAFWDWFLAHEDLLWNVEDDLERRVQRIFAALHRVDRALTFDLSEPRDGRREFVVSAGGNPAAFAAVVRLAQAAPPMARWTVRAFRPRRPAEGEIEVVRGRTVRIQDVRFVAEVGHGTLHLALFIPGFARAYRDQYGEVGMVMLDIVLGEFDVESHVGCILVGPPLPHIRGRPLSDLPAIVDAMTGN